MDENKNKIEKILNFLVIITSIFMFLMGVMPGVSSLVDKVVVIIIMFIMICTTLLYFANKFWNVGKLQDIGKASYYLFLGISCTVKVLTGLDFMIIFVIVSIILFIIIECL